MKKELLSPVGNFDTLKQAIHNGCDAVYLGGKQYGARKFADNFTKEELADAVKYCHLFGVKMYVTVNTIIFDNEVDECLDYIKYLHKIGVDAVIMQDIGMITLVRKVLPNLDIHISTQAHTHNINQIRLLEKLGVTRVVVAREMSIDDINKLDTNLEIEAFIHGALCICYSGQCLFSSMLLSRSGNRGECAGICRLPFTLLENDNEIKTDGKYLLSPKELNTTSHIKELMNSKITSFKIEGRMKGSETIGFITRLYRNLIDHYERGEEVVLTEEEKNNLLVLFNREYTDGFLFNSKDIMNIKSPNHIGVKIGEVLSYTDKKIKIKLSNDLNQEDGIRFHNSRLGMMVNFLYDCKDNLISGAKKNSIIYVDNKIGLDRLDSVYKTIDSKLIKELNNYDLKKILIDIYGRIENNNFYLQISDSINTVFDNMDIVSDSTGSGTSKDRIIEQLEKLGNTPFNINSINIDLDRDNIFIPISKINELRRNLIDKLIDIRSNTKKEYIEENSIELEKKNSTDKIKISVLVRTEEQLKECLDNNISTIYVDNYDLYLKYKDNSNIYLRLSRVNNDYKDISNSNLLIGEIGSINKYISNNNIIGDYFLNVTNSYYINYLRNIGLKKITLSIENSIDTIKSIVDNVGNKDLEVIIYGRLEAMVIKNKILRNLVEYNTNNNYYLKDRNKELFPVLEKDDLTHIFYYKNHELDNNIEELKNIGINNYRIELFDQDKFETVKIIKKYKSLLLDK